MMPGRVKEKDNSSKKRNRYYWNTSWSNSLKEISCLLPVSEPACGRALSKKKILIHMLQYFDFLQTHIQRLHSTLPPHCLPETNDRESDSESEDTALSEPSTPPCILKAKRKYSCGHPRKKDTSNSELYDDKNQTLHKEGDRHVMTVTKGERPYTRPADETAWSAEDNSSLPCSSDSNYSVLPTTSSSTTGSTVDLESPCQGSQCSICDARTGSEDGGQGNKELASPFSGSFILKDQMFGVLPPLEKKQLDDSPSLPHMPVLPFLPLLGCREGLNLSPSLLTSPTRGLSHTLLPEGQEELQMLFEDVWVTPNPAAPKSEEVDKCLDDITWTPNQHQHMKKGSKGHHKMACRKGQTVAGQKKKCVNGFLMFCRLNRRLYLRTHPGLPSTVVTKELANLWHIMPKQERRVYCLKARQFSREHNRNVRSKGQEAEEEEEACIPSPLHMLLAHRDLWFTSSGKA
ncbi:meiosis initiator protein-like isoform X1 [Hemibagrus wyckioides]|uniref:meiosis initiator protein-like isoform X1 n=2 Tax=Hemibagrus wyckioides TaxID=337641 RepID=UPI00266D1791|nr:meiosis initiator protein-like isoform X1 [Hemibagrus wyckioides]